MASIINSYKEDDVGAGSNCNEMQIDDCSESGHGDEDVNRHRFESTSSYTLPYRKPLPGTICSNTELNMNGELYGFDLHHTVGKNINTSSRPNVVLGHKRSLSSSSATFSSVKDSHVNIPPSNTNDRVSSSSNMSCTSTMSSCSSSSTSSSPFKKQNLSSMDHIQQNETQLQPPIVSLSSHRTSNSSSSSSDDENIHTFFSVPHTSRSYQNITNSNTNTTSSSNSYVKSVAVATNRTRSQSFHHGFKSTSTNSAPLTRYIHVTAPLFTSTSSCSQPIVIASSNMNNQINVTRDSISSSSSSSSPTSSPVSFSPNRQRGRQRAYTIHSNSISNNASHHYQHIGVDIPATSSSSTSPPFTRTHNDLSTIGIAIELLDRRRRSRSFGSGSNSSSSSGGGRTMRSHSASLMKQTSSPPRI